MKIGIYGGSFDPIHNGHIELSRYVVEKLELDKLLIVPIGIPSHKKKLAPSHLRFEICKLAFENDEKIEVIDVEINSNKISYTYDTLLEIIKKFPNSEYYEIIGEDSQRTFDKWKNYKKILELSKVVVLKRNESVEKDTDERFINLTSPIYKISSTEIRNNIKDGKTIEDMIPSKVIKIIEKYNLYR